MTDQSKFDFGTQQPSLSRAEGLKRLGTLIGQDLRVLAKHYGITVFRGGNKNKGWAGQTVEAFLGRSPNSDRGPDFGDWELKVVPLTIDSQEVFRVKESMAIAMFQPWELESQPFEDSHLFDKLRSLVLVARHFDVDGERMSIVVRAVAFDLSDTQLLRSVKDDYEEARWVLRNHGPDGLRGEVGQLVQTRVKGGRNKGARGHAFYARPKFVATMLGLD